jgi:hypothetical protein
MPLRKKKEYTPPKNLRKYFDISPAAFRSLPEATQAEIWKEVQKRSDADICISDTPEVQPTQPEEDEGYVIEDDDFGEEEGSTDNLYFDQDTTEKENYWGWW